MFKKIIFVCTGNICRSPIAEGLAKHRLASQGVSIDSLGTGALMGRPADLYAQKVMSQNGLDISQHIARQATESLLKGGDLILALDQTHLTWLNTRFPILRGRVHKLGKWDKDKDVPDPYQRPFEAFEDSFKQIQTHIEEWATRISK